MSTSGNHSKRNDPGDHRCVRLILPLDLDKCFIAPNAFNTFPINHMCTFQLNLIPCFPLSPDRSFSSCFFELSSSFPLSSLLPAIPNLIFPPSTSPLLSISGRRKWDREEYEKMAIERIEAEQRRDSGYKDKDKDEPEPKRELLKARDYKVGRQN